MGRSAENIEEKKKTDRREKVKSDEKEKWRIWGKQQQYTSLVLSDILLKKHSLKKGVFTYITWNFVYSLYALQDIWNTVIIHPSSIYINIQIII